MALVTDDIRAKAAIYHGKEAIREQMQRLLREVGLPNGLLPIDDAYECGHVEETGFVWLRQKEKSEHKFKKIGTPVSYATEVTAYAEPTKIKKLTGVKARELLIWLTVTEITVPHMNANKLTFKTSTGLSRTYPADAFVAEDASCTKEAKELNKDAFVAEDDSYTKEAKGVNKDAFVGDDASCAKEAKEVDKVDIITKSAAAEVKEV